MNVPAFARLPLVFDAAPMLAEARAMGEAWIAHFNTGYHDGGWQGVALRSTDGDARKLYADSRSGGLKDTEFMARCPAVAAALARIECPMRSVRLLRLAAGAVIREHSDDDLRFEAGEARLHIPLATNPGVEFYVEDVRVVMQPGECWYLNLSLSHRVRNRGTSERIHLVVDCIVNDWLATQVAMDSPSHRDGGATSGQQAFAEFRERVLEDISLASQLRAIDDPRHFAAKAAELGAALGLSFDEDDVRVAMTRGRQSWQKQWIA